VSRNKPKKNQGNQNRNYGPWGTQSANDAYAIERGNGSPWYGPGGRPQLNTVATTPTVTGTPTATGPTQEQQSAWAYMQQLLEQVGLGSLAGVVQGLIAQGMTDANSLQLALQDTAEWKARFAGNEALKAAGLPVMSVAEYLSTERSYAQIMKNYGLPSGFYDDPSDFAKLIGGSISANELNQRVSAWADLANREDPAIKEQLRAMGIADGDLIAYMMDPDRAAPLIQRTYQQALVGGAARRQGLDASGAARLVERGITEREALQGYGVISEAMPEATRLGDIYGENLSQGDLEAEVFENNGDATKKRKRLASRERAAFQGSSGVGQGSLSRRDNGSY
jgi:hypothetical protein